MVINDTPEIRKLFEQFSNAYVAFIDKKIISIINKNNWNIKYCSISINYSKSTYTIKHKYEMITFNIEYEDAAKLINESVLTYKHIKPEHQQHIGINFSLEEFEKSLSSSMSIPYRDDCECDLRQYKEKRDNLLKQLNMSKDKTAKQELQKELERLDVIIALE